MAGDVVDISLSYKDNGTGHGDLILRFAGQLYACDSYYLALDPAMLPERSDGYKIRMVLRRLLDQWLETLENIPNGGRGYLPFDFSDQYTGWLCGFRSGTIISVRRGWATVEGWSISPSAVGEFLTDLPGFRPEGSNVQVPTTALIERVRKMAVEIARTSTQSSI